MSFRSLTFLFTLSMFSCFLTIVCLSTFTPTHTHTPDVYLFFLATKPILAHTFPLSFLGFYDFWEREGRTLIHFFLLALLERRTGVFSSWFWATTGY